MVRIGLVIYLTLLMLPGPALCCCTTERLLASLAPQQGSAGRAQSGCRCHRSTAKDSSTGPTQPKDSPCKEQPCPLQHHNRLPVVVESALQSAELLALQDAGFFHFVRTLDDFANCAAALVKDAAQGNSTNCIAFPHLTSRDILRAVQVLRC